MCPFAVGTSGEFFMFGKFSFLIALTDAMSILQAHVDNKCVLVNYRLWRDVFTCDEIEILNSETTA